MYQWYSHKNVDLGHWGCSDRFTYSSIKQSILVYKCNKQNLLQGIMLNVTMFFSSLNHNKDSMTIITEKRFENSAFGISMVRTMFNVQN